MFLHELGRLETRGEIGVGGLFDHSGTRESDHALGLGDDEIAKGGEAGGDTSGGRVRQDGDVGELGLGVAGEGAAGLGHLHQAEDAFMHPGTSGGGKNENGFALCGGRLDGAGDFLPRHTAHAGSQKTEVHDCDQNRDRLDVGATRDHGVLEARLGLIGLHLVQVPFELERIDGIQIGIDLLEGALVHQAGDALIRADGEMVAAIGADPEVLGQRLFEEAFAAGRTLLPQPFGHVLLLLSHVGDGALFEKSHSDVESNSARSRPHSVLETAPLWHVGVGRWA